MGEPHKTKNDG